MFDVIDFLESLGQDAQLRYASSEEVVATLAGQPIDSELRDAILAKDVQALQGLLGQAPFCCLISPAKPDEGQDEEQEECDGSCKEGDDKDKGHDKDKSTDGG